jgi:hypothetical protein
MDFEACDIDPVAAFRGRAGRAAPDNVLLECWSSVANRVRCVLVCAGDFCLLGGTWLEEAPARLVPAVFVVFAVLAWYPTRSFAYPGPLFNPRVISRPGGFGASDAGCELFWSKRFNRSLTLGCRELA